MNQKEWEESVEWVGIVAGCVVKKDDEFLLVQEKQEKVYGLWNFPAGHVDRGENLKQAAAREVQEETGYLVDVGKEVGLFHEHTKTPIKHIFEATITGGDLAAQPDEILDVRWLSFDEVQQLSEEEKLRAPWILEVIKSIR